MMIDLESSNRHPFFDHLIPDSHPVLTDYSWQTFAHEETQGCQIWQSGMIDDADGAMREREALVGEIFIDVPICDLPPQTRKTNA